MTAGLHSTNTAHAMLNALRGVTFTAIAGTFIELHVGDPGAAGTSNPSAVTGRQSATFSAAAAGAIVTSNAPAFTMTATETITHIAVWSASTAGNFHWSAALTTPKAVVNTDTLTFTAGGVGISLAPLAA
jgi:hypothetical protein